MRVAKSVTPAAYLCALGIAALHITLTPPQGDAQPSTGIESFPSSPPLLLPPMVTPLPLDEFNRLQGLARAEVLKSPIQSKTVSGIHHVQLDPNVVKHILSSTPPYTAPNVIIALPNGQSAVIVTDTFQQDQDSVMWKGHVAGVYGSRVRFVVNRSTYALNGSIETGRFIYEIRPAPSNASALEILAIDPSGFPPEHGLLKSLPNLSPSAGMTPFIRSDELVSGPLELTAGGQAPTIDVMILYSTAARDIDPTGIGPLVCQAVDALNDAFTNSGINATARLVHHGVVGTFTEAAGRDIDDNLQALRDTGTTNGSEIYNLRNTHAADVVSLLISDAAGDYCGLSPGFGTTPISSNAFSVVVRRCAVSDKSFVHEFGHILLAHHDRFFDQAGTDTAHNYDYVKADKDWTTVMSYSLDRADCPLKTVYGVNGNPIGQRHFCNRRLSWSNPFKSDVISGDPMGEPSGALRIDCADRYQTPPIDCRGPAHNSATLGSWVGTVAAFRPVAGGSAGILGNTSCISKPSPPADVSPPAVPGGLRVN